jgi:ABC-type polar amino acid transport system ATPase subunit
MVLSIARAVAMDPKILLLDEITSALDPELVGEVLEVSSRASCRRYSHKPPALWS